MGIKMGFDVKALGLDTREIAKQMVAPRLAEMAQVQIANMRRRAQRGLGVDDRKMKKYSPAYAKKKKKAGRRTNIRDLTWTGQMMRAIRATPVTQSGGTFSVSIKFSDQANAQKAQWNQNISPFFGISPNDAAIIREVWKK